MSTHTWKWHLSSADAWEAMLSASEQAKVSIDLEEFIFVNDAVGERFVTTLLNKVGDGVRVRVLCDAAGSFFFSASQMGRRLREGGVELKFFNPISPWKVITLEPWAFRDHRKLLVIDRQRAFVGGVCIGEEFVRWRDTMVEISGEIAGHLQETFEHMWWATKRKKFTRFKDVRQTEDGFTVITNAPHFRQRFINRTFLDVMRHAKKYIYLTTPYFVPDRRFFRVLRLAARRGVDVRILLPVKTDHPYVDMASSAHFRKAFKSGVRIFRYQVSMLHAKTLVVGAPISTT